jgi:hypothetical protein
MAELKIKERDNERIALTAAPQVLTAGWVDLGPYEIDCRDVKNVALWLNLDVNDSTGVQYRTLGRSYGSTDWFALPIEAFTQTKIFVREHLFEFGDNIDQKIVTQVEVADLVPYIKFQIMATVAGATPGEIAAYLTAQTVRYGL